MVLTTRGSQLSVSFKLSQRLSMDAPSWSKKSSVSSSSVKKMNKDRPKGTRSTYVNRYKLRLKIKKTTCICCRTDSCSEKSVQKISFEKNNSSNYERKRKTQIQKLYDSLQNLPWAKHFTPENILSQTKRREITMKITKNP
ncbi:uncharacterized protein LOC118201916 [Stegodyphus dumicola]|uniref:uncharacterized protein LOC118201916 n=1 Tax=Stegodyphus dumicola TaxID=202533 RepID=UPI0015ABC9F8|nr:uncharacterized protein LOC118201916 [Stegodyphus dumicola]